jgi:hypothetical protein
MTPPETLRSAAAQLLRDDRGGDQLSPALRDALAEWLDAAADAWDEGMEWDEALAVARACLPDPAAAPVAGLWPPDAGGIAVLARNSLLRAGFGTAGEVAASTPKELLDIRRFGYGQLREVERVLAVAGLRLREGAGDLR